MAATNVVNICSRPLISCRQQSIRLLWFRGVFSTLGLQVGHRLRLWDGFSCFVSFIWCQLFACLIRAALFRLPPAFVVWSFFIWCQLFACLIRAALFCLPPAFVVWSFFIWCQLFACLIRAAIFRLPSTFVVCSFFFFCHRLLCTVSFLHGLFRCRHSC